ncbi:ferrochelatase [Bacteriovoracales bacterium]|nr:ferrochelatase [Bacteriovoracales bacterium]
MNKSDNARRKTKIVLVQLGSPKAPTAKDLRVFLKEFLGDPRVVDINPFLWKIILNLFVLPFRPARSAKLYKRIWDGESFPLIENTKKFSKKVEALLPSEAKDVVEINYAFLLTEPKIKDVWNDWEKDIEENNNPATRILAVALFPQYSESTVASGMDNFFGVLKNKVRIPPFEFLTHFHNSKAFIDNSVRQIETHLKKWKKEGNPTDKLIISFHGIPKRRVIYKGDIYYLQCFETFKLITQRLQEIDSKHIHMTFQSRFGQEEWLTPYTDEFAVNLVREGNKKIAFYCPSFVADCLETTDEIGHELSEELKEVGGEVQYVPCLNDDEQWCRDFSNFLYRQADLGQEEKSKDFYQLEKKDYEEMPTQKMKSPPLTDHAKTSLKIVFLTLFLDLVGFSIIFPLFPALAKHYIAVDGDNYFLKLIFGSINSFTQTGGVENFNSIVLFGGALGALYSFLQFVAAPIWGGLSDKWGRRPILLVSVLGLALSYLLWFFSGSFTLLILARFIGGIMGGNISTATAVVADVTQKENRSKGMATIGIAFALGFIIGPALGGLLSMIDLTEYYPILKSYGVNPFSMPALLAFILSCFNLLYLVKKFKETLPLEKRGLEKNQRITNPLKLFRPLPYKGVNLTNFGHFLFLAAFSGMEFTLTFLAVERLSYTSMDNAYMFIFIGVLIALVQGGYVRRKAAIKGEKQMALQGLFFLIPGLITIGLTQASWTLYLGLFFLAVGSSMVIPCLTSLVSLYTPPESQGQSIGIFRSLGALARVIGPIGASLLYWKMGPSYPYFLGAVFLLIPILMVGKLPQPVKESSL